MLQHTGMEILCHSSQCRISYIGYLKNIPDTRYLIFHAIVQYERDTNTDIVISLVESHSVEHHNIVNIQPEVARLLQKTICMVWQGFG